MLGVEDFYFCNSLYFSSDCLYFVFFDCSLEMEEVMNKNKIYGWLNYLKSKVKKNTSVVLVGTKVDILQKKFSVFKQDIKIRERFLIINNGIIYFIF